MDRNWFPRVVSIVLLGLTLGLINGTRTGRAQNPQEDKPAEQTFKNIKVMRTMPSSQLLPVMQFMRASLGVRCDYCHIAENDKYWMDDKPAKLIARQMIQMVFDLNNEKFAGNMVVTCNSCHQGRVRPVAIPPIGQGAFENTTREEPGPPDPLPTVDQVLDRYIQALGGTAAIEKIETMIAKGSVLAPKLVGGGTVNAHMIARGNILPIEIYRKAPDKYLSVITSPDGVILRGYNGSVGWIKTKDGQRDMNSAELARIKPQADFYQNIKLKGQFSRMTVIGREKIGDREATVVEALNKDNKIERLFFDRQSGLLVRRTVFTRLPLGLDPEQTDFEDYRDVGGSKLPFIIRVSFLDDSHLGTTRQFSEIKHNLSLTDEKFNMPLAK
jgi:hypothetical protein